MLDDLCQAFNDPVVTDTLIEVRLSCASATDIMQDLLIYEQIESRTLHLNKEYFDICPFLEENMENYVAMAKQLDITVTLDLPAESNIFIEASVNEFGLAARNLLTNAIKFTPPSGRVAASIYLLPPSKGGGKDEGSGSTDWVRFEVTDTGPGMTQAQLTNLLEGISKFTPSSTDTDQGRGVGFFVSYGIISLHGGRVGAESKGTGCGATFYIDMPVREKRQRAIPSSTRAAPPPRKSKVVHQGGGNALVQNLYSLGKSISFFQNGTSKSAAYYVLCHIKTATHIRRCREANQKHQGISQCECAAGVNDGT